jgi:hypothetical protein
MSMMLVEDLDIVVYKLRLDRGVSIMQRIGMQTRRARVGEAPTRRDCMFPVQNDYLRVRAELANERLERTAVDVYERSAGSKEEVARG